MSDFRLINVWTDAEPGPAAFSPMPASMLWSPPEYVRGAAHPAIVFLHRWGGYPYDPVPVALAPALTAAGFVVLSLCLRRRGMEGQLACMPEDDHRDIKLALDYLHVNGCGSVFLVGEQVGGSGALDYMATHRDSRVRGIAWLDPVEDLPDWLRRQVGDESYNAALRAAGIAARQGAGMDMRIDLFPPDGLPIAQQSLPFLNYWGPATRRSLIRNLEDNPVPLLLVSESAPAKPLEDALDGLPETRRPERSTQRAADCADTLIEWARRQGAVEPSDVPVRMVHTEAGGKRLFGLFWKSGDEQPRTATLLMHGLTSSPLSPLFLKMAPLLAEAGSAVLAVESRRSGWAGHESALLDYDAEDLDAWVGWLTAEGFDRIVLAGASMGSLSIGRFQSLRQHPSVKGLAHLMPTADCPEWFRAAAGDGPYDRAVVQAENAVRDGRGATELIDIDVRQPPPNRYGGRFRWTQRAASWLSWWGPDADSRNSAHIANAHVPLLLLSGTEDSYNDEARFAELKAAAVNAPSVDEVWYPDIDHGLARAESQVAHDMATWMKKIGVL